MDITTSRWIVAATLLWACLPLRIDAQSGLSTGDRVRVHQSDGGVVTGTLANLSSDGLWLQTSGNSVHLVVGDRIDSVERSIQKERRFARNFAVTLVGAAALGGITGAVTWSPCHETGFLACFLHPTSRTDAFGFGAVVGGALGLPLGVIVGLALRHDVWEPIEASGPGGFALHIKPVVRSDLLGFTAAIPVSGF